LCPQRHLELPLLLDHGSGSILRGANAATVTGPDGRWRGYDYVELIARDKASLDIFWLKDDALADSDNLPPPEVIAQEIVDDLEAALEQFRLIAGDLQAS
jgi:type I restriction enzyme M protein